MGNEQHDGPTPLKVKTNRILTHAVANLELDDLNERIRQGDPIRAYFHGEEVEFTWGRSEDGTPLTLARVQRRILTDDELTLDDISATFIDVPDTVPDEWE
ncbi:hypothetical protein IU438_18060 [Nocardia cyriacigeorgica]|uniref:hypothetical protein n=1 Tax=Nocardia cyriacigeorgica TaxID=135487 RepID=UPI0018955D8F|nr:hypothetical protein [Nocardia cyriacigeorgica]MBF6397696.1 hypothetical protein [Nocardia cyriacigeorgica]MBF6402646.1 hypothetical protein [Nocardia cyriacigeorgica]